MHSHLFVCVCFCHCFLKRDAVTFEAISQLFCSSDLFSSAPDRKKRWWLGNICVLGGFVGTEGIQ